MTDTSTLALAAPMLTYIGTKVINARPMNRADYVAFRGWDMPDDENPADTGYLVEYTDGSGGNVEGFAGYVTWSPTEPFEKAYRSVDHGLGIGDAVAAMVAGRRVARAGWNGKSMFAYFVPPASYPVQTGAAKAHFGEGALVPYRGYLALKTVDEDVATWAPSVGDTLATDWCVLPD